MNIDKSKIPEKFYKSGDHPIAKTVGELRSILSELPDELPIESDFSAPASVVVYNIKYSDCHCRIEGTEIEEDEDED